VAALPWLTVVYVAAGLVASFVPGATALCIYDRAAVDGGEWWRVSSAHFVHSSTRMVIVDLGAVALLGWWVERRSRAALVSVLFASTLGVGLTVHLLRPDLLRYHGASGVACALFAWVAVDMAVRDRTALVRRGALLALVAFLAKSAWEVSTGRAAFAGGDVVPSAHLSGALIGLAVGLLRRDE
jgi:rhomboid family GlyGly-CTERM serine protease